MRKITTDNVIIGAGTAGLAAYRAIKSANQEAILIEGGSYGTTCARVGCMPSKLLIAAAEAHHTQSRFSQFGIEINVPTTVNGKKVMARVTTERDRFVGFVLEGVDAIPKEDKIVGYARFIHPHQLMVDDHTEITFNKAIIATGSSPVIPPFLQELGERVIVNDDIFSWQDLPRSVAVFGPGVIGLELGQALHRLNVNVSLFGRDNHIGPISDPVVKNEALTIFKDEMNYIPDAQDIKVVRHADKVHIYFTTSDNTQQKIITVDYVVAATGRTPNVSQLNLPALNIELDQRGVPLFDRHTMQCGNSHIFIAGDANHDVPLLHEAADEGKIAGENAISYPNIEKKLRRSAIGVVFSDPQIAIIGQRFADIKRDQIVIGEVNFGNQGRSRVMLKNKGILRVYADKLTGRLLGAEMIGPDAEHLAHLLSWVHQLNLSVNEILALPFYHPVIEEGLRTALRDAQEKINTLSHSQIAA
ncbi:dihydrolipoyl dehydrogenase [Ferrovum sp. PN-J185]|uniref:dihydrolipoyl dehydrogenase n=1 Tax=Ferrovum sp. PN-J185 TaxID=1356306 RepID=UPI001E590315|nr:dihydrolipoyl dehydrogenase [Ferrovum sp. PN-J185]MCC6067733.1 dihydrolipoyl dehydrogenase [Ferrovum sp. PN-J185]MDE1891341.1 dihydrolipoyl dehydrogenase [Betaproteobacteria bacterium]MDE2056133.1 dihydrolipoyl dehydrogenase [Betaproteobacteria bacterium]